MPDAAKVTSHRGRRRVRWAVVAGALVVAAVVGYGAMRVLGSHDGGSPQAHASSTPLASMDLSGVRVARTSPCDGVGRDDVETALGGDVAAFETYAPGDRVRLSRGLRDLSQEFGCVYRGASGAEARVWVFAQPVDRRVASGIVRDARHQKGCRSVVAGPGFGSPTVTTSCPARQPRSRTVTVRGLYGDAWLTCELTVPAGTSGADPVRRTQQWCVRVVIGLGAR